ncbi:MAG: tetratricopeptide repeat protein [Azonexus sp.]
MSLINQMLQDLEKREGEPGLAADLPAGVHSARPARLVRWRWPLVAVIAGGLIALFFWAGKSLSPPAEKPVPAQPPVIAEAPLPPTVPEALSPAVEAPPAAPVASLHKPEPARQPKEKAAPRPSRAPQAAAAAKPAVVPPPARPKSGTVAKTSPFDEAEERAEQNYRKALAAYGQGRTTESLAQARQALVDFPAHHSARQLLLKQLVEQGANDQARALLRDGIRLDPSQLSWSMSLARLELGKGDVAAARQALDPALPQAAANADFQSLAGAVAQRQGRANEAADFYRAALRLKPADGRSWVGLALALEAEGHQPEASEAFRRALASQGLPPELQALAQRKLR